MTRLRCTHPIRHAASGASQSLWWRTQSPRSSPRSTRCRCRVGERPPSADRGVARSTSSSGVRRRRRPARLRARRRPGAAQRMPRPSGPCPNGWPEPRRHPRRPARWRSSRGRTAPDHRPRRPHRSPAPRARRRPSGCPRAREVRRSSRQSSARRWPGGGPHWRCRGASPDFLGTGSLARGTRPPCPPPAATRPRARTACRPR